MGKPMSGVFLCDLVDGTTDGMQQGIKYNGVQLIEIIETIIERQAYYKIYLVSLTFMGNLPLR